MAATVVDVTVGGICVVVSFDGTRVQRRMVEAMAAAAPHRGAVTAAHSGPDEQAVLVRLSSAHDDTGPREPSNGTVVVADARIDNAGELSAALARAGRQVPLEATPEVLIAAAYEQWGTGCAGRIVGDFAFVVWDQQRRTLVAARDPMGMRSLYFRDEPGRRVVLATEVKQLLVADAVPVRIDERAVAADMLAHFGASGWSFYEGIEQVPPGFTLEVDAAGRRARRFWDLDGTVRVDADATEAAGHLRRVLTDAVADRMQGTEPTGILLSGGMDSGSVASIGGWLLRGGVAPTPSLHAFSWAFEELPQCDERHISGRIVDEYGLEVTEIPADDAGPLACYPEHQPDRDDPFLGAFQPLIEHSLAAAAAEGVGVVLGGDRGDLTIGDTGLSYLRMLQAGQLGAFRAAVAEHRRVLDDSAVELARRHLGAPLAARLRRRTPAQWVAWAGRRASGRGPASLPRPEWVREDLLRRTGILDVVAQDLPVPAGLDAARAQRYRQIFTPLHMRGMTWSERTYARYGLGFADPFSDRRVVEVCVGLPQAAINRPGDQTKPLLRAAMRGTMPPDALRDADKILPTPLYDRGLRQRQELIAEVLAAPVSAQHGWVDASALRDHFHQWRTGGELRPEFWWTLQVELWLRAHWT